MKNEVKSPYYSRQEVVSAGEAAWAMDDSFRLYAYDGARFWRRRKHSTRYVMIATEKAPAFGWMHEDSCGCHLCATGIWSDRRAA
jgi:hypothetical protein